MFTLDNSSGAAVVSVTGVNAGGNVNVSTAFSGTGQAVVKVTNETGFEKANTFTGNDSDTITAIGSVSPRSLTFNKQSQNENSMTVTVSCGSGGNAGGITLDKTANRTTYSEAGETIEYTYEVTNNTGGPLNPIQISDDKINGGTPFDCGNGALASGGTRVCTAAYTVLSTDVDDPADEVTNTATATGKSGNVTFTSNEDSVTVRFAPITDQPAISLSKTGDISSWSGLPTSVVYTYRVRNVGDAVLDTITITDDRIDSGTPFACGTDQLAVGAERTCQKTYVAVSGDLGSDIVNEATASGKTIGSEPETVTSDPSTWTVTWLESSLTIEKTANQSSFDEVGDVLTYTILVTNTGSTVLTNLVVTDSLDPSVDCGGVTSLDSGGSVSCSASYTVKQKDIDAGIVKNTATADSDQTGPVSDSAEVKLWASDDLIERTFESASYNFMAERLNLLASNGPRLAWLVNRLEGGFGGGVNSFNVSGENGDFTGSFAFSSGALRNAVAGDRVVPTADVARSDSGVNAWIEGQFALYNDDREDEDAKGDFFVGYAGVDVEVMDRVNIGIMGEIDWMNEDGDNNSDVEGTGWMIGPYLSAEITKGIFLDMRAMGGRTDNSISQEILGNDYDGDFQTSRWLAEATLAGNWDFESVTLTPDIRLLHIQENQENYTVSSGARDVDVDGNDVMLTQLSSGLRISHLMVTDDMLLRPYIAGRLFWNIDNPGELTIDGEYISTDDVRGAITVGVDGGSDAMQFGAEATYDGLFGDNDYAISGRLSLGYRF